MKQNLGILMIIVGTIMLVASYVENGYLVDCNWWGILALVIIIAGIVSHIAITKRS